MKKSKSIWLLSGAAIAFGLASCTQEAGMNTASQTTIDSIVNAKVDSIRISMMASNDSLIEALAYQKADSIVASLNAKPSGSKAPVVVPPKPKPTPEPVRPETGGVKPVREAEQSAGGLKSQSDQNKDGGGLRSKSDQAKQEKSQQGGGGLRSHSDQNKGK